MTYTVTHIRRKLEEDLHDANATLIPSVTQYVPSLGLMVGTDAANTVLRSQIVSCQIFTLCTKLKIATLTDVDKCNLP